MLKAILTLGIGRLSLAVFQAAKRELIWSKDYHTLFPRTDQPNGPSGFTVFQKFDSLLEEITVELKKLGCFDITLIEYTGWTSSDYRNYVSELLKKYFPGRSLRSLTTAEQSLFLFRAVTRCFNEEPIIVVQSDPQLFYLVSDTPRQNGWRRSSPLVQHSPKGFQSLQQKYAPHHWLGPFRLERLQAELEEHYAALSIKSPYCRSLIFAPPPALELLEQNGVTLYRDRPRKHHPVYTTPRELERWLTARKRACLDHEERNKTYGETFSYTLEYALSHLCAIAKRLEITHLYPTALTPIHGLI